MGLAIRVLLTAVLLGISCGLFAQSPYFVDVADSVGIDSSHGFSPVCLPPVGTGAAWADVDNDGDLDLFVTELEGANHFYLNIGDTDADGLPNFDDIAAAQDMTDSLDLSHSAVFIDYDNDGDQDLYITNWGYNTFYQNQFIETGSLAFLDVTVFAGLVDAGRAVTSSWGDYDRDGYLDVYLSKHRYCNGDEQNQDALYKNNGDGTFSDVTGYLCPGGVAPCDAVMGLGFTAGWIDLDNDRDADLYLVNDDINGAYQPNVLWRNDGPDGSGGWIFTDISVSSGSDISLNGMGLGVGDYDNDGFFDLAFSNIGPNYLLRNLGNDTYEDVSAAAGIVRELTPQAKQSRTWGTVFWDYDNDQWQDLLIVAGNLFDSPTLQPNAFFANNKDGTFDDISAASGLDEVGRGRAAAIADFDKDGYVDVFIGNLYGKQMLFRNEAGDQGNQNNWLAISTEGTISNRDGIGTRIRIEAENNVFQIREINSGPTYGGGDEKVAYFGLGTATTAEVLLQWPSGESLNLGRVNANQRIHVVEPQPTVAVDCQLEVAPITDSTFTYKMTFENLTDQTQPTTFWVVVNGPSAYTDTVLVRTKNFGPYQSIFKRRTYTINGVVPGTYTMTLSTGVYPDTVHCSESQDFVSAGPISAPGTAAAVEQLPKTPSLAYNYPNPFNPETTFGFQVSANGLVTLKIYDVQGQLVKTVVNREFAPGAYEARWDGTDDAGTPVASGVYIYRLRTGEFFAARQMMLTR